MSLSTLPDEILDHIFSFLHTPPPSAIYARHLPQLSELSQPDTIYKQFSHVNRVWRRVARRHLFRHARVQLDVPEREHWVGLDDDDEIESAGIAKTTSDDFVSRDSGQSKGNDSVDDQHAEQSSQCRPAMQRDLSDVLRNLSVPHDPDITEARIQLRRQATRWARRIVYAIEDLIKFLQEQELEGVVQSLVVYTDAIIVLPCGLIPHENVGQIGKYYAAASVIWQHIFAHFHQLESIVVIAPPVEMGCLAGCATEMFGVWAYEKNKYQRLELTRPRPTHLTDRFKPTSASGLRPVPRTWPGMAASSVFNLMPWSEVSLNEGTCISAHHTYEFCVTRRRSPPSILGSLQAELPDPDDEIKILQKRSLPAVRMLRYTAIFPLDHHVQFDRLWPQLDELDLQLSHIKNPELDSALLELRPHQSRSPWLAWTIILSRLTEPLSTFQLRPNSNVRLKTFICRDVDDSLLSEWLDEICMTMCLPVWAETEPGRFTRLMDSPHIAYNA